MFEFSAITVKSEHPVQWPCAKPQRVPKVCLLVGNDPPRGRGILFIIYKMDFQVHV